MRTRLLPAALLLLCITLLQPGSARAQEKLRLSDALPNISWDAGTRGPLLAVDPAKVTLAPGVVALPPGRQAATLPTVAPLFSRRVLRVGDLTVLAPEMMAVLNTHPEDKTDIGMDRSAALRLLMQSFNEEQWKKTGSENGIGLGDMETDEQRELFSNINRTPLPIQQYDPVRKEFDRTVLPVQRLSGLRFRVQRNVFMQLTAVGADGTLYAGPSVKPSEKPNKPLPMQDRQAEAQLRQEAEGRWTVRNERNRLKPGDLDFDSAALNSPVRLGGLTTVGELVKRCATATRIEMYADGRMARLPLAVRAVPNQTARAGDLLKGLCWMVTGTFRKVVSGKESALVLTDDREGYGTRMARIAQVRREEMEKSRTAAEQNPYDQARMTVPGNKAWGLLSDSGLIGFTPMGAIRTALDSMKSEEIPNTEFSEEMRQRITQAAEEYKGNIPLRQDVVLVRIIPRLEYLIPGVAPISGLDERLLSWIFHPLPPVEPQPEPGPIPAPITGKLADGLTVLIAPASAEEVRATVRTVAESGVRFLWIQGSPEVVRAGVEAGRDREIAVGALVSLLRADSDDTLPRDLDIFGAKTDWLLAEAPETLTALRTRLRAYAAIPGLAGLVLTDTAPPGCGIPDGDILAQDGSEVGYTLERRLAYLRAAGFDPIDLVRGADEQGQLLPFLRDHLGWDETSAGMDITMFKANRGWGAARYAINLALLRRLHADLRTANPKLPVLVRNRGTLRHWYGSWDMPETLPHFRVSPPTPVRPDTFPSLIQVAHGQSRRAVLGVTYLTGQYTRNTRYAPLPDGAAALARAVNEATKAYRGDWEGLVLDLRTIPPARLSEVLGGIQH